MLARQALQTAILAAVVRPRAVAVPAPLHASELRLELAIAEAADLKQRGAVHHGLIGSLDILHDIQTGGRRVLQAHDEHVVHVLESVCALRELPGMQIQLAVPHIGCKKDTFLSTVLHGGVVSLAAVRRDIRGANSLAVKVQEVVIAGCVRPTHAKNSVNVQVRLTTAVRTGGVPANQGGLHSVSGEVRLNSASHKLLILLHPVNAHKLRRDLLLTEHVLSPCYSPQIDAGKGDCIIVCYYMQY